MIKKMNRWILQKLLQIVVILKKIKRSQIPHFKFYYKICNKKNYKNPTGWGAGQPGFPYVLFRKKNYKNPTGWGGLANLG